MSIEKLFLGNLENWKKHCEEECEFLDCQAYRNLVMFGKDMLPFIKQYSAEIPRGLIGKLVEDITDDFEVPGEIRGNSEKAREYTVRWLDEYLGKS